MTIDEIKSVSIIQFLESQGHQKSYVFKGSYWYLSHSGQNNLLLSMSILPKIYGMIMAKDWVAISLTLCRG